MMTKHLNLLPHSVTLEDRGDGTLLMRSGLNLGPVARTTSDWLRFWAQTAPDRVFLAERSGAGWRTLAYGEAYARVVEIAGGLLGMGLGVDRPLLILSGNSVDHGLVSLAAHHVGIPTVPVAEQYSLIPAALPRLQFVVDLVRPGAVFASDPQAYGAAITACGLPTIASCAGSGVIALDALRGTTDVEAAHAAIGPDTVAKILMTSGSTSDPKGVETTQRMLTTNQAQIRACLPFLERPPVLVDWLPWNHVFGGSYNFNLVLSNGGSLYIDDGKPLPALFSRTIENLGLVSGSISFNVPVGFAQLVQALRADVGLRRTYFAKLDMIFYAGASLPQDTWEALEELALGELGRLPLVTSSWGLTETAPGCTLQYTPAKGAGIVGVPMPGVAVKLVDDGEGRMDVRVAGDSIFQRYHNNPEKTQDAFDDEGYFLTGDAMRFVDRSDPAKGLKFDGRLSEDFKLSSGTWVRAANLRLEVLPLLAPYVMDVIVCGAGRDQIGLLIVPNRAALEADGFVVSADDGLLVGEKMAELFVGKAAALAGADRGSAQRISCLALLSEPPSMAEGEVTAKGNINFPKLLRSRENLVARLYTDDRAVVRLAQD